MAEGSRVEALHSFLSSLVLPCTRRCTQDEVTRSLQEFSGPRTPTAHLLSVPANR